MRIKVDIPIEKPGVGSLEIVCNTETGMLTLIVGERTVTIKHEDLYEAIERMGPYRLGGTMVQAVMPRGRIS